MELYDLRTDELVDIAPQDVLAVLSRAHNMDFPAQLINTGDSVVLTDKHGTLWVSFIGRQRVLAGLKECGHIPADVCPGSIDEWRQVYHRETDSYSGVAKRIDDFSIGIGDIRTYYEGAG